MEVGVVAIIIIVAGAVIKAYRDGETTLECVMAFAVTDDIKRQERLWKIGSSWMRTSAHNIRRALVEGEIECLNSFRLLCAASQSRHARTTSNCHCGDRYGDGLGARLWSPDPPTCDHTRVRKIVGSIDSSLLDQGLHLPAR